MIIVWGSIDVKPESLQEATQLSIEHVQRSRQEPGCISHSVQVDLENPNRLVFVEEWESMSALQVHFKVEKSGEFIRNISKIATLDPTMKIFESTQVN